MFGIKKLSHQLARVEDHLAIIHTNQIKIYNQGTRIMAAIDDLKASLSALVTEAVTDLEAVIAKLGTPGTPDDQLLLLVAQANDTTAKLKADFAAVEPPAA